MTNKADHVQFGTLPFLLYGRTGWKTLLSGAALYDTASWQGISPTVHQSTAIKFNSKTKTDRGNSL
jgi:hypothetical protein